MQDLLAEYAIVHNITGLPIIRKSTRKTNTLRVTNEPFMNHHS